MGLYAPPPPAPPPLLLKGKMSVCVPSMRRGESDEYGLGFRSCINPRRVIPSPRSILEKQFPERTGAVADSYGIGSLRT